MKLRNVMMAAILFLTAFSLYLSTCIPEVYTADSGELVTSTHVLGIPHPTGYPLYQLAAKAGMLSIPFGSIAFRSALISVVSASLFLACFFILVSEMLGRISGLAAALFMGTGFTFWSQSVIQEVYTFHLLLLAASVYCIFELSRSISNRRCILSGFVIGLGLTHHLLMILVMPGFVILLADRRSIQRGKITHLVSCGMGFALGFSVNLYLPIRSFQECAFRWIPVHTMKGFLFHATGRQFRSIMFNQEWDEIMGNLIRLIRQLNHEWLPMMVCLAFLGIASLITGKKYRLLGMIVTNVFVTMFFTVHYRIMDVGVYTIQIIFFGAILMGAGIHELHHQLRGRRMTALMFGFFWLSIVCGTITRNYYQNDRSKYVASYLYGKNVYNCLPPDAILITQGWSSPFIFSYFEHVMFYRPDVGVFVDYKGQLLTHALQQRWRTPVYSTVPLELPGFETIGYTPQGLVYRFDLPEHTQLDALDPWLLVSLKGLHDPRVFHDFHGRALEAKYHYIFGEHLLNSGRIDEGLQKLADAEVVGRGNNLVLSNLSAVNLRFGRFRDAVRLARQSIQIDDRFYHAHHNLGNALLQLGDFEGAIKEYQHSRDHRIALGRAHQAMGYSYLQAGNPEAAIREFRLALRTHPDSPDILNDLGYAYLQIGSFNDAAAQIQKAIDIQGNHPEALNNMGLVLYESGDYFQAESFFLAAIDAQKDFVEPRVNLGVLKLIQGQPDPAEKWFRAALRMDPRHSKAEKYLEYIQGLDQK